MPTSPWRVCAAVGCRQLGTGRYCDAHAPASPHRWDVRRPTIRRVRGRALQAARRELFAREPLCRACSHAGRARLATVRDHIVPLAEGGADDDVNVQPLCDRCSTEKTREETARGRARRSIQG